MSLSARTPAGEADPFVPGVYAVRIPPDQRLDDHFPEMAMLMRPLRREEIDAVIEDVRASEPGTARAERIAAPFGDFWLATFDDAQAASLEAAGVEVHPVPIAWDESRFRSPADLAADMAARAGSPPSGSAETPGVAIEALENAPVDVPSPSCASLPAVDNFCPYDSTVSATRGFTCARSLYQQLIDGETAYPPITVGGILRDYYRVVNVGTTAGQSLTGVSLHRPVIGVRLGRAPDTSVPTVRQAIIVAGQHASEWEAIEMARRLIFYFASQYASGNALIRQLLDQQALLIVPAANPDGYQTSHDVTRGWRGNMQWCTNGTAVEGIDINRNFPFTWGIDNEGSDPQCADPSYRGASPGQAAEVGMFESLVATAGYRTAVVVNVHTRGGAILLPAGFSPGLVTTSSPCRDQTNCTNPDLGIFYRLAGTERSPILRHPNATSVPYVVDQGIRVMYPANGLLDQDMEYGALPPTGTNPTPSILSMTVELAAACGLYTIEERTAPTTLSQEEADLRQLAIRQLVYLDGLVNGTTNAFELPILQRRNVGSSPAAEALTLRVAVRNNVSGCRPHPDVLARRFFSGLGVRSMTLAST